MSDKNQFLSLKYKTIRARITSQYGHWLGRERFFTNKHEHRWIVFEEKDAISRSQTYPLHFFSKELRLNHDTEVIHLPLDSVDNIHPTEKLNPTAVFFQCWINKTSDEIKQKASVLRDRFPNARLIFLDPGAPTDFRHAAEINPYIDAYIKKHSLVDQSYYRIDRKHDTNLSEWYSRFFSIPPQGSSKPIPETFLRKVRTGTSFAYADYLIDVFSTRSTPLGANVRPYVLHARLGGADATKTDWYHQMRQLAVRQVQMLNSGLSPGTGPVDKKAYLKEMGQCLACFSPFGYGEVCWRDYEAIAYGSVLIKPRMDHILTTPNIFKEWETYIPCEWDFSDIEDVVSEVRKNPDMAREISHNAFEVIKKATDSAEVLSFFKSAATI